MLFGRFCVCFGIFSFIRFCDNASELFQQPDIDGGLIGGASLKADKFTKIIEAAAALAE